MPTDAEIMPASDTLDEDVGQAPRRAAAPIILEYWNIAHRHLWLIAGIVVALLVAGLVVTLLMTPQYTATSRIEIARQQANVTNVEGIQREESSPDLEFYSTQYSLLNARSLAERVGRRLRLARNAEFFAAHGVDPEGEALFGANGGTLSAANLRERERQVTEILLDQIAITPIRGSALVDVQYTSGSAVLSTQIANAWVQEFIQQSMDRRFASTSDARVYLETRLQGLRERLEQSERDLVNYAAREGIVRLSEARAEDGRTRTTQTLASTDLETLNRALTVATAERVEAEGELRAAMSRRASNQSVQNVAINQIRQRRAEAAAKYAELLVRFEPEYPAAREAQQAIRALDNAIAVEEGRVKESFETAADAARQRENSLRARVDGLLGRFDAENRANIQYNIYQREVDTNRQLYDSLLQRYKEIGVAGVGTNNIAIVDGAIAPNRPSSPKLILNLALALLIGLAIAAIAVFILENLDEGLKEPGQIPDKLGVPLLGAIPLVPEEQGAEQISDPKSVLSEAYMTVRTNLAFSTDHGLPRTLALTSTSPSEGKSTSSFALAQVVGRTGKSVVVIDVDMRRPMMATMLGLSNAKGVANYLSGEGDWQGLIQKTDKQNVSFVAAGPTPPSASELLSSDRLSQLLASLMEAFDHVIVDCPPMLGLSDAPLIARSVEGIVYVIEAERTAVRAAQAAIGRLKESRGHVFGAILTKYRASQSGYGYGYGFGYGYGRDQDEAEGSKQ